MKKIFYLFALLSISLFSCSSDDFEPNSSVKPNEEIETLSFIYNEETYSSTYHYDSDSILVFDSNEFAELYESLNQLPDLATLVIDDELIEYFDNSDILQETLKEREKKAYKPESNELRSSTTVRYTMKLYDQTNYSGRMVKLDIGMRAFHGLSSQPDLNYYILPPGIGPSVPASINFDNKLVSVTITPDTPTSYNGLTAIFYDNPAYKGKSRTYANFNSLSEPNFGKYKHTNATLWNRSKHWGQVISSIKFIVN